MNAIPSKTRVVVTGLGVVAPNAVGLENFERALRLGTTGITFHEDLANRKFGCQIGGIPPITDQVLNTYLNPVEQRQIQASGIRYGIIAGKMAWLNAGLKLLTDKPDPESGMIFGSGMAGAEITRNAVYKLDNQNVKRLGSSSVPQVMASGISAYLGGMLGLGNWVTTNASACATGTEAVIMGYRHLKCGLAKRMLVGSCDSSGPYVWGGFDAMRVTNRRNNDNPSAASRPMSASAQGFVPGSGAGAMILETLESALHRKATIYGEVLGGALNSGGHKQGGTLTAPNPLAVRQCLKMAISNANIHPHEVDLISGHLTATKFDPNEIQAWADVLQRKKTEFPFIHSLKSMIGHCLSAAGSIESVAAILQLYKHFIHPSINCEDPHPDILDCISPNCIPQKLLNVKPRTIAKCSFGFGDINSCVIFRTYE